MTLAVVRPLPAVSVTTGPTSVLVADLSVVKTELGLSGSSQDTRLTRMIRGVSGAVAGVEGLRRDPWRATYTMDVPGLARPWLAVPRWPLESVTSVTLDGTTVAATEYAIGGQDLSMLYADEYWTDTAGLLDYQVIAVAGWVMPPDIGDWAATTAYGAAGGKHFARASDPAVRLLFEATTAGTSGSAEPTWPSTVGGTAVDGTVTWTARAAKEFPADLAEACLIAVMDWYNSGLQIPTGVASERIGPWAVTYREGDASSMPPVLRRVCEGYR